MAFFKWFDRIAILQAQDEAPGLMALPASSEGKITVFGPVVRPSAHLATIDISQLAKGRYPHFADEYLTVRSRPNICRKTLVQRTAGFRRTKSRAERLGLGRKRKYAFTRARQQLSFADPLKPACQLAAQYEPAS
ncbi:hypothetical protein [Sphingomonas sp. 28-62-11]|uniref:hypothetical protein n=1 Tax=Sphingomonas sp. 28-62-11 TaxID=1970432 RepID=UPI000BDC1E10|nr:MAG: hypothetical protein B7Y49_13410 [Sphingomonas sp. 28-62-11]